MNAVENQLPEFEGIPSAEDLARIADLLIEAGLETIELSDDKGARCFMRVTSSVAKSDKQVAENVTPVQDLSSRIAVSAPYFGTLVLTELAKVGTSVQPGDVVAQMRIGALQIPVLVPVTGTIVDVAGEDGALTGYGAPVVQVEPTSR
ncbi:hypothetical protein AD945_06040 [Gluconobacter albidus]|uniref:Lipoyl-binding domain-containing protein n=1 Tax=Gluconobacter albidus TaxID=318683 RepID=A0A149TKC0_9PROT|nr:hypothetical protein [Gluconobacter albidus]KXV48895.1 hypothetical protein AD945_06040 [Gluconobacter albidus]